MNHKKKPIIYTEESIPSTYQTGSTNPPKSHAGLLTFLLSLTILICGASTILSLMRINLLQKILQQTENQTCTMAFAEPAQTPAPYRSAAGFQGTPLDSFWQSYHDLPQGIYVTDPGNCPQLRTGDVILSIGQVSVCCWEDVDKQLQCYEPNAPIPVTVYRDGAQTQLTLINTP